MARLSVSRSIVDLALESWHLRGFDLQDVLQGESGWTFSLGTRVPWKISRAEG